MRRGFVDTSDGQIHYREERPADESGDPVVVLNATPLASEPLIPFLRAVGRERRAIGMDTPGYGDSERPPEPYTNIDQFAAAVIRLVDGLGIGRFNLVGTHTGAQIALQVAVNYPDRVAALVLQEAFNWNTPRRREVHQRLHFTVPRTDDGQYLLEMWRRTQRAHDSIQTAREHELRLRDILRVNEPCEAYGTMGWEGAGPNAMSQQDVWEVAPRIQAPTLLTYVTGRDLERDLPRFLETIPRSRGYAGGPSILRDPEESAAEILAFVREPGI